MHQLYQLKKIFRAKVFIFLISSVAFLFLVSFCKNRRSPAQHLAVNEVGYLPDAPKLAFFSGSVQPSDSFTVVDSRTSQIVFQNAIDINFKKDPATGEAIDALDFTGLNDPGTYRIKISALDIQSSPFRISEDVYNIVTKKTAESFYYQRCGTNVDNGTQWSHTACHLNDAVFYGNPQKHKDVTGGWHDAGDYGKYSVNTAFSLGFLLYLYDHRPQVFTDGQFDITPKDNGIPDLLDEGKWALRWLMKMQRSDGAVFHKVQKKKWTGEYLPQNDPDKRYIYEVSSTATADFAAVAALGSRLFKMKDVKLSNSLKKAAQKAWGYLDENPGLIPKGGFENPQDVKGGEYGDHKDSDERLWASVELYRLTRKRKYHKYFLNHYAALGGPKAPPVSWKNVAGFAYYSYLYIPVRQQNHKVRRYISEKLMKYADKLVKRVAKNGYRVVLKKNEYYWGSNSVVLGYAFVLVQTYELNGKALYKEAALDQLHYILGRNVFGLSFATGIGERSVQNPYHQFSMKLNNSPVPGMVVGGSNNHNRLDAPLSKYPAKNYEDSQKNYKVNETAINYTAPLVYLSGYFSAGDVHSISEKSK